MNDMRDRKNSGPGPAVTLFQIKGHHLAYICLFHETVLCGNYFHFATNNSIRLRKNYYPRGLRNAEIIYYLSEYY